MEIYQGKIKDCISTLEKHLVNSEKLIWDLEQVKKTLQLINDDLEADRRATDQYFDRKESEVLMAIDAVENQKREVA